MLPDFTVIQDYGEWTFRATTDRARRWLDESTTVFGLNVLVRTDELIVAKEMAKRVWRTLSEEGFQMVTLYHGHDFADQQSALLMARAIANAGKSQDALHRLVDLRDDLVNDPTNPKAATLLVEVDRAIDYAFGICRTDRQAAPAVSESTRGGALLPRLRRTMREFDGLVVHTAISIILVVDVYNVIHNLTHV